MPHRLMDFEEAKEYLKLAKSTFYRLLESGQIPASKVGRQWRFKKEEIDKWLEEPNVFSHKQEPQQAFSQIPTVERRRYPRIKANLSLNIKSKSGQKFPARIIDVGERGLSLEATQPITFDSDFIVFLTISDYKLLDMKTRIIWSRFQIKEGKYYYGLEFVKMEDSQRRIIKKIIRDKTKQKQKFAFITNLRDAFDWSRAVLMSNFIPKDTPLKYLKNDPGYIIWTHFDVYDRIEGYIITILLTAEEIKSLPPKVIQKKILDACLFAQNELGVEYIGLGSYIPSMTNNGAWLAMRPEIKTNLTHGDSYTVAVAIEGLKKKLRLDLSRISIAIIGATGLIGQTLSRIIAKECKKLILIARNPNKLERLREFIYSENKNLKSNISTSIEMSSVKDIDMIISVTSSPTALIRDEDLKEGAIIYDLAQPMDVYPGVCNKRPDILRVDGSYVNIPNINVGAEMGPPKGATFACLAEVILQTLEDKKGRFVGPIKLEWVEEVKEWAKKYNFSHAQLSCYSFLIPKRFLETHRNNFLSSVYYLKQKNY